MTLTRKSSIFFHEAKKLCSLKSTLKTRYFKQIKNSKHYSNMLNTPWQLTCQSSNILF